MAGEYRTRQERKKAKKKSRKKAGLFKKILLSFIILFLVMMVAGGIAVAAIISNAPPLDPDLLKDPVSSVIYDKDDQEIATISGAENREIASIQEIPEIVQNATLAIEDVRFREHFGLDIRRIGGAVVANITEGFGAEGGSTITQQVVKQSFLSFEKTLTRKIQEAYLAIKLEQKFSKDQILEMYLNKIYYGNGAYGIKTAAETYFQKELDELTVSEAAFLAGLPQRPSYYENNLEAAEQRRNTVISAMLKYGFITEEQANEAKAINAEDMLNLKEKEQTKYDAFINQVFNEVEQIEGMDARDIYEGGLKIYTTLDVDAQEHMDELMENDALYPDEAFQAGIVLVDTETGAVRAIGGGRNQEQDEDVARNLNFATQIQRQPGSAIKPILDYGPAIEYLKWSTGKLIKDEKLVINGKEIRNWDRQHRGLVSMRTALEWSYNVPAVNTFLEVGEERVTEFAENLGIKLENITPAYAIGGFSTGVSPLQLAGAYAAFGNEGIYHEPYTVKKIVFPDGREIDHASEPVAAMSDYTAYMITDMLKTVVRSGTGTNARVSNLPMAGKTGTTNLPEHITGNGTSDGWFAGYTTKYTVAVWTGYEKTTQEHYVKVGSDVAQRLFKEVMSHASEGIETPDFVKPDSVVEVALEKGTEKRPSPYTPKDQIIYELFVRGTEPTEVSDAYDQPDAPTNLQAVYDEGTNAVKLSWDYGETEGFAFTVNMSVDGGSATTVTTTTERTVTIPNVQPGSTYSFQVIAINQETNAQSEPASTQIQIPGNVEEEPSDEEQEPQEGETTEPGEDEEIDSDDNQGDTNPSGGSGSDENQDNTNDNNGNENENNDKNNNGTDKPTNNGTNNQPSDNETKVQHQSKKEENVPNTP